MYNNSPDVGPDATGPVPTVQPAEEEEERRVIDFGHAELMFGMASVMDDLLEGKSSDPRINAKTYAKHMKYVAERGLCKNYKPGTLNRYEHKVTTKVLVFRESNGL